MGREHTQQQARLFTGGTANRALPWKWKEGDSDRGGCRVRQPDGCLRSPSPASLWGLQVSCWTSLHALTVLYANACTPQILWCFVCSIAMPLGYTGPMHDLTGETGKKRRLVPSPRNKQVCGVQVWFVKGSDCWNSSWAVHAIGIAMGHLWFSLFWDKCGGHKRCYNFCA